jgi:4-hydroxyproline epimerase
MPSESIPFVDTHTGGEPTRVLFDVAWGLRGSSVSDKLLELRERFDDYRTAVLLEPRGHDVLVGALVTESTEQESTAGVVFFNNVGYLGMCGHGTIGVAVALRHLGRISMGHHRFETPVGPVDFLLEDDHHVSLTNVPSYRFRHGVPVELEPGRIVHGDIAWGGNWFFICQDHGEHVHLDNLAELDRIAKSIRRRLGEQGIGGDRGAEIDHIELIGPASDPSVADAKNFVLCPGGVFDRSPCGTGTSAKVACLAADNLLTAGEIYRQESIVGSVFQASYQSGPPGKVLPTIRGSAFVTAEGKLFLDSADPFRFGINTVAQHE